MLFLPSQSRFPIESEESVLEVALRNGLEIDHSCGGMGSCTTCRVFVESVQTELPPRNELETDIANMREFQDNERLSCQLPPQNGLIVRVPQSSEDPSLD